MADNQDNQMTNMGIGPVGGDLPAGSTAEVPLSVDERQNLINAKKIKKREDLAAEVSALLQGSGNKYKVNQYGRFKSIINLENATEDENGIIRGAKYIVQPNEGFRDLYQTHVYDMGNYTKGELFEEGKKRDNQVLNSANLQYYDGRNFRTGQLVHGETTAAARELEETVWSQARQGLYDAVPFGAARVGYGAVKSTIGRIPAGGNPVLTLVTKGLPLVAGAATFGYSIAMQEVYTPDMAEKIFEEQNKEIEEKKKNGYYVDGLKPRILTLDEIRDRLDPEFASFRTKLVNTLARNSIATAGSLVTMGGLYVKPVDKLLNVVSGGRLGSITNAIKKSEKHFVDASREAATRGIKLKPATPDMIRARARIELMKDIENENLLIWGKFNRFINTFASQQKLEQFSNPLRYTLSMIGAEGGANLGISLAAYHSWLGSGKTEELGKLPFAFGGSIIGTSPLVAIPVGTTRFTLGLIGAIGDAAIDQFQDPAMTAALLGPNRNRIFKFLSGTGDLSGIDLSGVTYAGKQIDGSELRTRLYDIREMLVESNVATGGEIIDNLRVSVAAVDEITQMVNLSGNKNLIDKWKPEFTMGVLLKLDIVKAMQIKFLQNQMSASPNADMLGASIKKHMESIQSMSNKTLSQANEVLSLLMDGDLTAFANKPAYLQYTKTLSRAIDQSQEDIDTFLDLADEAVMYRWNAAIQKLLVTAEEEGMSQNTLKIARELERIIDDNPMFGKLLGPTDNQSEEILEDAGNLQNFKDEIYLAINNIYKKGQGAEKNLEELYNSASGKANIDNVMVDRADNAINGKIRASEYEAWNRVNHIDEVNRQSNKNYAAIGETPDDGFIDVTDMWRLIQEEDLGKASAEAEDQMAGVGSIVNQYFKTNVRNSVNDYLAQLDSGGEVEAGYKVLKEAVKDKIIDGPLPAFNDREKLALFLTDPNKIQDLNEIGPVLKIRLNIDEAEELKGKFTYFDNLYDIRESARFPDTRKKAKADTGRLWGSISAKFNAEYKEKMPRINQKLREKATSYFRDTVIPMRGTWFYKNSYGSIKNADPSSITGFNHGPNPQNQPAAWLDEFYKMITDKESGARNAKILWQDFVKFYGPPEIKLPDGKVVRNDRYHNALEAISDYLEFQVHGASEGMLYDSTKKGEDITVFGVEPDTTTVAYKEQKRLMDETPGETDEGPLVDKTFGKTADGTPFSELKYNNAWQAIINFESASKGAYQQNLSYSSAEELNKIIKSSEAGGKIIKKHVDTAIMAVEDAKIEMSRIKSVVKTQARKIQDVLNLNYKDRGNTAKMVQALIDNPENYDILKREIGQTSIDGVIITPEKLIQSIVTDGLINMTKGDLKEISTKYGIPEVIARTDGLILKYLIDQNPQIFETVFEPDHLRNIKRINNFLLRFVTDDVLNPASGDTMFMQRPDAQNIQYSNTKIMNRIWTTQIGKTTKAWLGIEAAAAVMFNTDSSAFGAILLNANAADGFADFLFSGKLSPFTLDPKKLSWFEDMVGASNSVGNLGYQVFVSDDEEAGFFMWLEDTGLDSKLSDKNYGELRKQYMEAVGGNAFMQSKKYLGNQMRDLFF